VSEGWRVALPGSALLAGSEASKSSLVIVSSWSRSEKGMLPAVAPGAPPATARPVGDGRLT
jgi:hypothetical protein